MIFSFSHWEKEGPARREPSGRMRSYGVKGSRRRNPSPFRARTPASPPCAQALSHWERDQSLARTASANRFPPSGAELR